MSGEGQEREGTRGGDRKEDRNGLGAGAVSRVSRMKNTGWRS